MFESYIYGFPKKCLNSNCKEPFTQKSHLGWLPKSAMEVYSIVRCSECKSKFKVSQPIEKSLEYFTSLPQDAVVVNNKTITDDERINVQLLLDNKDVLDDLNNGMIPGASNMMTNNDE
jgi:hypothetical protein